MGFRKSAFTVFLLLLAISSKAHGMSPLTCISDGDVVPCAHDIGWDAISAASGESDNESALSESATVSDAFGGSFSLNYPQGWTLTPNMDGTGTISLTGPSGMEILTVLFMADAMAAGIGDNPTAVIETLTAPLEASGTELGELTETELGDNAAAYRDLSMSGIEMFYYVVELDDGYVIAVSTGIEMEQLEAILMTVSYDG